MPAGARAKRFCAERTSSFHHQEPLPLCGGPGGEATVACVQATQAGHIPSCHRGPQPCLLALAQPRVWMGWRSCSRACGLLSHPEAGSQAHPCSGPDRGLSKGHEEAPPPLSPCLSWGLLDACTAASGQTWGPPNRPDPLNREQVMPRPEAMWTRPPSLVLSPPATSPPDPASKGPIAHIPFLMLAAGQERAHGRRSEEG